MTHIVEENLKLFCVLQTKSWIWTFFGDFILNTVKSFFTQEYKNSGFTPYTYIFCVKCVKIMSCNKMPNKCTLGQREIKNIVKNVFSRCEIFEKLPNLSKSLGAGHVQLLMTGIFMLFFCENRHEFAKNRQIDKIKTVPNRQNFELYWINWFFCVWANATIVYLQKKKWKSVIFDNIFAFSLTLHTPKICLWSCYHVYLSFYVTYMPFEYQCI